MTELQRRYDALRRQRTAHGATLAELTTLDDLWTLARHALHLQALAGEAAHVRTSADRRAAIDRLEAEAARGPADPVADALRAQVIPPMPQPPMYARLLNGLREEQ